MNDGFIALEEECVEEEHILGFIRRWKDERERE